MKKILCLISLTLVTIIIVGCDPSESLEAIIVNNTNEDLSVIFDSEIQEFDIDLTINASSEKELLSFQANTGGVVLSFRDYDSIYIQNSSNEILKVFKENTIGKNIYNVEQYWTVNEPSKNLFRYSYEITSEDIE